MANVSTHPRSRQECGPSRRWRRATPEATSVLLLRGEGDDAARAVDRDDEVVEEVPPEQPVGPRAEAGIVGDDHQRTEAGAFHLEALDPHREHVGLPGDAADRAARRGAVANPEGREQGGAQYRGTCAGVE